MRKYLKTVALVLVLAQLSVSLLSCGKEKNADGDDTLDTSVKTESTGSYGSDMTEPENEPEDEPEDEQKSDDTQNEEPPVEELKKFSADEARAFVGSSAVAYTVGEDRYDIDCDAYLQKNASFDDYKALLSELQSTTLKKYTDNGENGIDGACYQTTLYDRDYTVNVTFYTKTGELYMTVEKYRSLSAYQLKSDTPANGTDTSFHMPEMPTVNGSYKFGECEIFRLSSGHFIIVDGAQEFSAEPTIEYLEKLTPDGEIPVVDGWFLTHAHPDHAYCVWGIGRDAELVSRVRVEGFYYTWPNDAGMRKESDYNDLLIQVANVNGAMENFRDTKGEQTPRYKLHGGMRFYFGEIEVQVLFTQDQIMPSEYGNGFNDTSTSFKFIVRMQDLPDTTFLVMGDASSALCKKIMKMYTADTLHTTFFQSLHHGSNDCLEFFQYIKPDYLNYTYKSNEKGKNKAGYKYLASVCKDVFCSPTVIKIAELYR